MLLHIPHSSTVIPPKFRDTYIKDITDDINFLTDHFTDELFTSEAADRLVFPFSRLFCDVERLLINEPMDIRGMGICYTKNYQGDILRQVSDSDRKYIINTYYNDHHKKLDDYIRKTISFHTPVIIDCHSFDKKMVTGKQPDFCIGHDEIHTPLALINGTRNLLTDKGYTVKENTPFAGTIVPARFKNDAGVKSIMIEINRDIYMTADHTKSDNFDKVRNDIADVLNLIDDIVFETYG